MTAITMNPIYAPLAPFRIVGESDASKWLERANNINVVHARQRPERERAFSELAMTIEAGKNDNWDQYGAVKIDRRTQYLAFRFLDALPTAIPAPEIGLDPDGEISFEWFVSENRHFSVSLSPEGILSYAGFFGTNSIAHGTEEFDDTVPQAIISAIRRLRIGQ